MANRARGIPNRRDFLSASPRARRQEGWMGGAGAWGTAGAPEPGDRSSHPLPSRALSLRLEPAPRPAERPWGDCFPSSPRGPPEQSTTRPRARAAWLSLLDDLLRPLTGNIVRLCKTRDRLWGRPDQPCSSFAVVAVTTTTPAQSAFVGQTQTLRLLLTSIRL